MDFDGYFLLRHSDLKIKNHIQVRGNKSPYDGDYIYWSQRMGKHPMVRNSVAKLLKSQKGRFLVAFVLLIMLLTLPIFALSSLLLENRTLIFSMF